MDSGGGYDFFLGDALNSVRQLADASGAVTQYYLAGASRVAMRKDGTLYYLFSDQLGSSMLTVNAADNSIASELRYKPWGEIRYPADGSNPRALRVHVHGAVLQRR